MNKYPYTNFQEYNLDWIILQVKTLLEYFEHIEEYATEEYVDNAISELNTTLRALIDLKLDKVDFDTFVSEVQLSLSNLESIIRDLQLATQENAQAIIDTYNTLKRYIDDQLIDLQVINPLTGNVQPIQLVLNYMADLLRADSLTAQEYDSAELTASAYDNLELTAYVYDNYGKNYIGA